MDGLGFVKSWCFDSGRNTSFVDNSIAAVCLRNFRNHETRFCDCILGANQDLISWRTVYFRKDSICQHRNLYLLDLFFFLVGCICCFKNRWETIFLYFGTLFELASTNVTKMRPWVCSTCIIYLLHTGPHSKICILNIQSVWQYFTNLTRQSKLLRNRSNYL